MIKNIKISTVSSHVKIGNPITLEEYVNAIVDGTFKTKIDQLRMSSKMGKLQEVENIKRNLPAITPHGVFETRSGNIPPVKYSQILAVDIDHLSAQKIDPIQFKKQLRNNPHVVCAHLSCSGDGMVIFIKHSGDVIEHQEAVEQICNYIEYNLNVKVDKKASKGINNQRFCSYDPDAIVNWNAKEFELIPKAEIEVIEDQIKYTNQKEEFKKGSRNNWFFLFACNCNRSGVPKEDLKTYASRYLQRPDFNMAEIIQTVNSAYKIELIDHDGDELDHDAIDHLEETANGTDGTDGTDGNGVNPGPSGTPPSTGRRKQVLDFRQAPVFPPHLYKKLPKLLQNITNTGENDVEKDLALLTALTGISSLFPNVILFYGHNHSPNLFTIIVANAGEGKSKVNNVIKILDPLNTKMVKECGIKKAKYKKLKKASKDSTDCDETPEQPDCKGLMIPDDITHASLLDKLASNSTWNLLYSSETDSVNRTMANEQFNKSDVFRKCFHHERISHSRRGDDIEIHIEEPKLSILLTGTPASLQGLVKGVEDGTSSRFIYYGFASEKFEWKSQQSEAKHKSDEEITILSETVIEIFDFFKDRPIEFDFTKSQTKEFDEYFKTITDSLDNEKDGFYYASIKRLALTFKRIAAIFTAVEAFENKDYSTQLTCTDNAFSACKDIIGTLLEHAKIVYSSLENRPYEAVIDQADNVYRALPDIFSARTGYDTIKKSIGLSERTVRNYYKKLLKDNRLIKTGDTYKKVKNTVDAADAAVAIENNNLLNNN